MCVCVFVCSRTPPRPFDGFTSFLVKRCFSYPDYTLSIFRDLDLNVKVTMADKVQFKKITANLYCNSIRSSVSLYVCLSVCSRTPPRPFDGFTSYLVKSCFSYPSYTLSIFRDLELNFKVTMPAKVTKFST